MGSAVQRTQRQPIVGNFERYIRKRQIQRDVDRLIGQRLADGNEQLAFKRQAARPVPCRRDERHPLLQGRAAHEIHTHAGIYLSVQVNLGIGAVVEKTHLRVGNVAAHGFRGTHIREHIPTRDGHLGLDSRHHRPFRVVTYFAVLKRSLQLDTPALVVGLCMHLALKGERRIDEFSTARTVVEPLLELSRQPERQEGCCVEDPDPIDVDQQRKALIVVPRRPCQRETTDRSASTRLGPKVRRAQAEVVALEPAEQRALDVVELPPLIERIGKMHVQRFCVDR